MDDLTPREKEVATLLCDGMKIQDVANELGIAKKTADVHKTRIYKKWKIHNRVELLRKAFNYG